MSFFSENSAVGRSLAPYGRSGEFADPFLLPSNEYFPTKLDNAFDFCAYLWYLNPTYRQASVKVCSHFITDVDYEGKSGDRRERNNFYDLLRDSIQVFLGMLHMGMEWSCYGNGFSWLHFPFNRYLIDDRDKAHPKEWALEVFEQLGEVKYHYKEMEYEVYDMKTIHLAKDKWKTVRLKFRDRWTLELDKIRAIVLDPRNIILRYSRWSGRTGIIWKFDPEFISDIRGNLLHQINDTPIGMLRAVANDQHFLFDEGEVFHLKAPSITGISNMGWGVPEVLANYRNLHQVQVLRKVNEAVGLDYMLPFRLFSPNTSGEVGENSFMQNMGHWTSEIKALIRDRRMSPFSMHALPFPVTYQEFGAEGKNLAPHELLQFETDNMLDAMGYPAELWHGSSLNIQQIPTKLRLFENAFQHLFRGFHNYLKWVARSVQEHAQMETMEVGLQPPSLADDLEKRPIYLQLTAGGEFPRSLALKDLGVDDPVDAARERFEEDIEIEKVRNEISQKYEREQSTGSLSDQVLQSQTEGAAGGAPSDGAGGLTPIDTMQKAQQEAQSIVQMDQGAAQQRWDQLRAGDQNFYAMVKNEAEKIRNTARSQGMAQLKGGPPA